MVRDLTFGSYRVQALSRAEILQEFDCRCQALAASDCRGFKREFEVTRQLNRVKPASVLMPASLPRT